MDYTELIGGLYIDLYNRTKMYDNTLNLLMSLKAGELTLDDVDVGPEGWAVRDLTDSLPKASTEGSDGEVSVKSY